MLSATEILSVLTDKRLVVKKVDSSNLVSLTTLLTIRPLTQFEPKIKATCFQKSAKICLAP